MATADLRDIEAGAKPPGKKDDDRLSCVVVTPERTLFDELVDFVALPLYDGELGVLPGRTPLIGRLGYGELRTRVDGLTRRYFVDGGFVQVRDNIVTVLTGRAVPADQVDAHLASEELEHARARRATTDAEQAEKEKAIARARAMLRVAAHRG
ncbi:MAG: ATP synthase F1 subunit epsilon [Isosphaeraceae bacterium]|nr:ATP synthase F1 subunit epsilon [Isosphaeraceae bacterium]